MNLQQMRERLNQVASRLSALAQMSERTAEQETELDQALAEFNDLAPQVERLAAAQSASDRMSRLQQSRGAVANQGADAGEAGDNPNNDRPDRRSIGQRFAESREVADFLRTGGRRSAPVRLGALTPNVEAATSGDGPVDRYALIETGVLPGYMVPPLVTPGIFGPRDYSLTMRSVLVNGRTTADTIYFIRELAFTNEAAETAEATAFDPAALGSSGRKPQSSLTFEQDSAPVVTIAHWIPITRQALADAPQLRSYVENRLLVGLERRLNGQILNGGGTGADMTGILNTNGIQVLDDAAFSSDPVQDAGHDNENFNRILRGITEVELTGDARATFIVLNPRDFERLQTTTDANRQYMGAGPFASPGMMTLWGLPVVREREMEEGHALVGDGTMAAIWDREDAQILIDTINDQFIRNMLTLLAELRAALTVFRPAAFADVELVTA